MASGPRTRICALGRFSELISRFAGMLRKIMGTFNATSEGGLLETASQNPAARTKDVSFRVRLWKTCRRKKSRVLIVRLRESSASRSGWGFLIHLPACQECPSKSAGESAERSGEARFPCGREALRQ